MVEVNRTNRNFDHFGSRLIKFRLNQRSEAIICTDIEWKCGLPVTSCHWQHGDEVAVRSVPAVDFVSQRLCKLWICLYEVYWDVLANCIRYICIESSIGTHVHKAPSSFYQTAEMFDCRVLIVINEAKMLPRCCSYHAECIRHLDPAPQSVSLHRLPSYARLDYS